MLVPEVSYRRVHLIEEKLKHFHETGAPSNYKAHGKTGIISYLYMYSADINGLLLDIDFRFRAVIQQEQEKVISCFISCSFSVHFSNVGRFLFNLMSH